MSVFLVCERRGGAVLLRMDPFSEQLLDVLSGRDDGSWMTGSSGSETTRKGSDLSEGSFSWFVGSLRGSGVDVELVESSKGIGEEVGWKPLLSLDVGVGRGEATTLLEGLEGYPQVEMELITPGPDSRCASPVDSTELDIGREGRKHVEPETKVTRVVSRTRMAELSPIPEPKQYKRWKNATPSKFCHFCGRLPKGERVVCRNITQGTCRKVFCKPCMEKIFGEWDESKADSPTWECTHCAGVCPKKASCRYYSKTNNKRFQKK